MARVNIKEYLQRMIEEGIIYEVVPVSQYTGLDSDASIYEVHVSKVRNEAAGIYVDQYMSAFPNQCVIYPMGDDFKPSDNLVLNSAYVHVRDYIQFKSVMIKVIEVNKL